MATHQHTGVPQLRKEQHPYGVWTQWSRPIQTVWNSDNSFKCQESKCINQSGVKSHVLFCLMHNGSCANLCQAVPAAEQEVMSSSDNNCALLWLLPTTDNNTVGTQKYASSTIHTHCRVFLWKVTVTKVLTEFTQATEPTTHQKRNSDLPSNLDIHCTCAGVMKES